MANIMDMKMVRNKPSRNGFDLSTKRNFTAKVGELLPFYVQEVIPGDTFNIDLKGFSRTAPINTAANARIREYYDFYYVPYHLLWNRANEVLSKMDYNQQHATALNELPDQFKGELPYVTTQQVGAYLTALSKMTANTPKNFFGYDRAKLSVKLLEYLGYGNFEVYLAESPTALNYNVDMNIMGLLAYQKVYSDWFRNQQWEKPSPSTFNCDYMNGSTSMNVNLPTTMTDPFFSNYNMFDLRYCDWPKDLYHGVLPQPQYGDTAVVPLLNVGETSGQIPVAIGTLGKTSLTSSSGTEFKVPVVNVTQFPSDTWKGVDRVLFSTDVAGISVLALRQAEFYQKWKEIAQSGDQDYKSITKRIWGVDVPNGLSDKSNWLGGTASSFDINEVVNSNITGDYGAAIAGKAIGISSGKINFKSDNQYGIIIGIYHAVPLVDYTVDYIDPMFTRINAEDFADPTFDRVGMEGVSSVNIMNSPATGRPYPDGTNPFFFGYAPRYITYKTAIDLSFGAYKRDLKNWVLSYNAQDILQSLQPDGVADKDVPSDKQPVAQMNYTFFKVNPNLVDPIFAIKADSEMNTDQFWCSIFLDIKAVRNLDVDGLPY